MIRAPAILAGRTRWASGLAAIAVCVLAACGGSSEAPVPSGGAAPGAPSLPWPVTAFPAMQVPADNPSTVEKVELGRLLFHDPLLSEDRKVACVTCHSQYWGMSDGLSRSIGVGGKGLPGTGRTGPTSTRRNAPSLWNAGFREALFWDGRAPSLEAQVLGPLTDAKELGRDPAALLVDLRANAEYAALFARAFPGAAEPVSLESFQRAIASFVRTLVSDHAPYDRYVKGDDGALGQEELRGLALFGEAGCAGCHRPPTFDAPLYARATPPSPDDRGRAEVTGRPEDEGAMRVPSLRNLRHSAPYFHDGSLPTIRDAAARMAEDFATRPLSPAELDDVATFLDKSLVDRTHEPARPLRVPSGLRVPDDGFTILRGGS